MVIAREDAHVIRAARAAKRRGKPVVCLATDLPRACRHGYVGSDERNAGRAAAKLIGDLVRDPGDRVVFITSEGHHVSKDREAGFTEVLARDFPRGIAFDE